MDAVPQGPALATVLHASLARTGKGRPCFYQTRNGRLRMSEESMLPPSSSNGWKIVFALLGLLAVTGLVLSLVYRDSTKPGEVIRKAQRKAATRVVYTIVFSRVDAAQSDRIITEIVRDLGTDTATADLIIGSPVTDPWCASISEYKRNLRKAMTETKIYRSANNRWWSPW